MIKHRLLVLCILSGLIVIAMTVAIAHRSSPDNPKDAWDRCAATNPVMESYPPQCNDEYGHHVGPPNYK